MLLKEKTDDFYLRSARKDDRGTDRPKCFGGKIKGTKLILNYPIIMWKLCY